MVLFSVRKRTGRRPMQHGDNHCAFLENAAGEHWDEVRGLLEEYLSHVSDQSARDQLTTRIVAGSNHEFDSAWWKIHLHETFVRCGFEVLLHPGTGPRHPDFQVSHQGASMFVEATSYWESSGQQAEVARQDALYRALDDVDFTPWDLAVRQFETGGTSVPLNKIIRRLSETLDRLPQDGAAAEAPIWFSISAGRATVRFEARLRTGPRPAPPFRRAVSQFPMDPTIDTVKPLMKALRTKSRRYGQLEHPLMIAISVSSWMHSNLAVDAALFGSTAATEGDLPLAIQEADGVPRGLLAVPARGFWREPESWVRQHVPAVLVGLHQNVWSTGQYAPSLWIHPAAPSTLAGQVPVWAQNVVTKDGRIERHEPVTNCTDFFELPRGWPGIQVD